MKGPLNRGGAYIKGRTIRKVMGGGFSKRQYIFFCTPIEDIYFFSQLMAGNFFLSEIYRPIFQARNFFFALCLERFFFLIFF